MLLRLLKYGCSLHRTVFSPNELQKKEAILQSLSTDNDQEVIKNNYPYDAHQVTKHRQVLSCKHRYETYLIMTTAYHQIPEMQNQFAHRAYI